MPKYYLRSNVVAEPTVNYWYAWPMLISPATAALITSNAHLSIMRSYLDMPKMHEAAIKDSHMRGGPFIDGQGDATVLAVKAALEYIETNCADIIEFAKALNELNKMLLNSANGHSMIPLYEEIPEILRGFVELVYDLNHRPTYRIIEGLLYNSKYYHTAGQALMLSLIDGDERPFVLSTPRFPNSKTLHWQVPFADPIVDEFFALRQHGISEEELDLLFKKCFPNQEKDYALFRSFFTKEQKNVDSSCKQYLGDGVRIRYLGHACVLVESKETNIILDCMVSYQYPSDISRVTFDELPDRIDYVLLTHAHQDHVLLEHLLQLRYKISTIVVPKNVPGSILDPSLKLMFQNLNFRHVIELDEMERIKLSDGEIIGIPFFGEHGDLYINSKLAYFVQLQQKSILFLADSNNIEPMLYERLKTIITKVDVIFLGMECDGAPMSWLYGPVIGAPMSRTMDQSRRLNGSDGDSAMEIIRRFDCKEVYIYAMGQEPWLGYITSIEYTATSRPLTESNRLMKLCQAEGRVAERPYAKKEIILAKSSI